MNNFSNKIVIAFIIAFFVFLTFVIVLITDGEVTVKTDRDKKEMEFKIGGKKKLPQRGSE